MPSLTPFDEHFVHQIPEPLSVVGIEHHHWRESYFVVAHGPDVDSDAIVILEVFAKKTAATPKAVIATCRKRLKEYDDAGK